ncbi:hypothetical protein CROQUDRAFT_52879 [Cronartium quercuum f. sp. fusiforme G11]|uniref:Galactose mutarotase-like protein n=1 Tax=Cronartium quercuum f. sp. fusiforme G11 TaxID=708437 RepID=A0A9P6N7Z0_9BASI|nr:hypothetical protein CROQUDRAFT_52879 [Cronartium quercuum f. sp. fusiforme G11]
MVRNTPQACLKPDHQLERVYSRTTDNPINDSLSDLDYEDESLSIFPPQTNSPLLPTNSKYIHSLHFPSYTSRSTLSRVFKCKLSLRVLKIPALVLLCISVIIGLLAIPWSGLSTSLAPDLYKYQSLDLINRTDPFAIHHLSAPDGSIHASFIGLGASIQTLMVKDRSGSFRDVVLGYDNISQYLHDPAYPRFGSVVGRYANRIKNSSFTLSGAPSYTYKVTANEHGGLNTLHGGRPGWDRRPFTVENKTLSYLSFSIVDPNGEQGFPNQVVAKVEYELLAGAKWKTRMSAVSDGRTPIMLSSHVYWNLDAYASNYSALDHFIQIKAPKYIVTDNILIPTGEISSVTRTPLDFTKPKKIGTDLKLTAGLCGVGCIGYASLFFSYILIYLIKSIKEPVMEMWSEKSGIKMTVTTDQLGLQIYTCNDIQPIPRKVSHQGPLTIYENHTCVVIEQQSLIDGINNPHWGIDQVYSGPSKPYEWNSLYEFISI